VPLSRVSEVVLVGYAGATTPAMLALLDEEISLTLLTYNGKLRGRLTPPTGKNVPLRRLQYQRANEPEFCLALSKTIVEGKLRNSRSRARRMLRFSEVDETMLKPNLEQLNRCLKAVPDCANIASLMGQEGIGAKAYFAILRAASALRITNYKLRITIAKVASLTLNRNS